MKAIKLIVWFILGMGWIYGFIFYTENLNLDKQAIVVLLVLAPFTEEIMFRETFYRFGKRWNCMAFAHVLSAIIFAFVHQGNYFVFSVQYAMFVQGMMGIIIFQVRREYSLFWCVIFHSAWNATILYIF